MVDLEVVRQEVLDAFEVSTGYYFHRIPHRYENFIDGMAWVGILSGACHLVGDDELAWKCDRYLRTLVEVGRDARNFAPVRVGDSWRKSESLPGYWYREKPQVNAGPLGLAFAKKQGAEVSVPDYLQEKVDSALKLRYLAWGFGWLVKYFSWGRQHINTMFLPFLLKGDIPPSTMEWLAEENPFFSYIFGKRCNVEYPSLEKLDGKGEESGSVVPLVEADPSSWIFRRDPFQRAGGSQTGVRYVRTAELVGRYLQSLL